MIKTFRQSVAKFFNSGLAKPAQWLVDALGGGKSVSGEIVNAKTAMGLGAYLACVKNISEDIAKMPLGLYEKLEPRGRKLLTKHPVHRLIHTEPNREMSAMTFRETLTAHALGYSGGYAEIVHNGAGVPAELWPLDPTTVQVRREESTRELYYQVGNVRLKPYQVLHIHGLGFDGLTGYVLSQIARDVIGNALASQKFAGSYFSNGTTLSGVIHIPGAWTDTAFKHFRESFSQRHGGAPNQHKPLILENDAKWESISSNPKDSQMIEVLQSGDVNIARLFRMPPHKIQDLTRGTFSNIEQQAQEYVTDCLVAWAKRWEEEIDRKLLLPREKGSLSAKINFNMLLRGDTAARSAFYRELFNIGAFSANDIRELEDMNPVEGGDTYFVNAALVPLDIASTGEHLAAMQPKEAPQPPRDEPNEPQQDDQRTNPKPPENARQNVTEHKRELLGRVGAAHTRAIEDVVSSLLHAAHDKVTRASKKGNFDAWSADFFGNTHKIEASNRLKPVISSLAASLRAVMEK